MRNAEWWNATRSACTVCCIKLVLRFWRRTLWSISRRLYLCVNLNRGSIAKLLTVKNYTTLIWIKFHKNKQNPDYFVINFSKTPVWSLSKYFTFETRENMEGVYEIFAGARLSSSLKRHFSSSAKHSRYILHIATREVRAEKKTCLAHGCNRPVIMHSLHRRAAL